MQFESAINTAMKITEVLQSLNTYRATVRVHLPDRALTATTSIGADTLAQARALLLRIYGLGNVVSVSEIVRESTTQHSQERCQRNTEPALFRDRKCFYVPFSPVSETAKPLSPQQAQAKALSDRAKQLNQQAKQIRAQQSLATAQRNIQKAKKPQFH
jgi:hypothetical protein